MHDDHFHIIETSGSWADGYDQLGWLPDTKYTMGHPYGQSLFTPGMSLIIIKACKGVGISNPKIMMTFIRLCNTLFSILALVFSIKLIRLLNQEKESREIAWVIATLGVLPFLGVRSLVEVLCIPFLIISVYQILKIEKGELKENLILWTGFLLGVAFSIRFQSALFTFGVGLYLVLMKNWKGATLLTLGFAISTLIFQGLIDYMVFGYPFAEIQAYVEYNSSHANDYIMAEWWAYILVLMFCGFTITGIGWFIGFFKVSRKYLLISLPILIFLAFHIYFPNRQERFILPIVPLFIILGMMGWHEIIKNKKGLVLLNKAGIWMFFIVNIPVGLFLSTTYSKRSRVEAAYYLYENPVNKEYSIVIENSVGGKVPQSPWFYSQLWYYKEFLIGNDEDYKWANHIIPNDPNYPQVRFVFIYNEQNHEERLKRVKEFLPNLEFEKKIESGSIDNLLHFLNPRNNNFNCYIYRNTDFTDSE